MYLVILLSETQKSRVTGRDWLSEEVMLKLSTAIFQQRENIRDPIIILMINGDPGMKFLLQLLLLETGVGLLMHIIRLVRLRNPF